jgi:hypothetical protein
MKKVKEYFFSYGTLQKEETQLELLGRILNGTSDSLRGYKLSLIDIKDQSITGCHPVAMLTKDKDDIIDGTIFEVTAEDLELFDSYKVDDFRKVKAVLDSGKEAWLYVEAECSFLKAQKSLTV